MKTLNELYAEVTASDALKAEFLALKAPEDVVAFAAKHGCDATLDEIQAFFEEKQNAEGELSEDDLEQVAGGKSASGSEAKLSIYSLGVGCAMAALGSLFASEGHVGVGIKGKGLLCANGQDDSNFTDMFS